MGGGLMQLVAYGAQDIYLTSNPQITFFKVVYRRHTNFAIESIQQTFNGSVDFGKKVTCTVSRNGDLIHKVYLEATLADPGSGGAYRDNIGHVMIDEVAVEIGGQTIDKHYGEWLTIWNELTQTAEKETGYDEMVGASPLTTGTVYVPLQFWFCRNPGLALPLIALQYHEVKFHLSFRAGAQCVSGGTAAISNASLYIDYIYLDTDERRQFAQVQHEYLIEQLQFTGSESYSSNEIKPKLSLNHPCKELVWVLHTQANENAENWSTFSLNTDGTGQTVDTAKLQLNGHDRFSVRGGAYFNLVQPYQHHTRVPAKGIYVYSFALNPEQHQPSGTVNMSRIDNATLHLKTNTSTNAYKLRVYAVNYNVLRVMAGMGGLAYSN